MRLCFATNNGHKLSEIRQLVGDQFEIVSLNDIGHQGEIPENFETMEENSLQKAEFIKNSYGVDCFADDSGLEVESINGDPGVRSARYAGPQRDSLDNNAKLLQELSGIENRSARFKSVISLVLGNSNIQFEGIVNGQIIEAFRGKEGFGYDPIFVPDGYEITFAEMEMEEKNQISHRGIAVNKLVEYLKTLNG